MTITKAHTELIARLAALRSRPLPTYPPAEDVLALNRHLQDVALAVDAYILEIGREAQCSSRNSFDLAPFTAPLTNAIQGNATYELECLADEWDHENEAYENQRYEGVG